MGGLHLRLWLQEAKPELVSDFELPRAVWGSRFVDGLSSLLAQCHDADALKQRAEMMGDLGHIGRQS